MGFRLAVLLYLEIIEERVLLPVARPGVALRAALAVVCALFSVIFGLHRQALAADSIVCFQSSQAAQVVRNASGRVPSNLLFQITSIEAIVLRTARMPVAQAASVADVRLFTPTSDEGIDAYLARFEERLAVTLPGLAQRLALSRAELLGDSASVKPAYVDQPVPQRTISPRVSVVPEETSNGALLLPSRCTLTDVTSLSSAAGGARTLLQVDRRLFQHPRHSLFSQVALILERLLEYNGLRPGMASLESDSLAKERLLLGPLLVESPSPTVSEMEGLAIELGYLPQETGQWESRADRELDARLLRLARLAKASFARWGESNRDLIGSWLFELGRELPAAGSVTDISQGLFLLDEGVERGGSGRLGADAAKLARLQLLRTKLDGAVEDRRRFIEASLGESLAADPALSVDARTVPGAGEEVLGRMRAILAGEVRILGFWSGIGDIRRNPYLDGEFERAEHFLGRYPVPSAGGGYRVENPRIDDYPMPSSERIRADLQ